MPTDLSLPARDGVPLGVTLFEAELNPRKGVVLINSATAVKRTFYAKFAAWLGFFRSSAEQTLWPQAAQWLAAQ